MKKFTQVLSAFLLLAGIIFPSVKCHSTGSDAVDAAIIQKQIIDDCHAQNDNKYIMNIKQQIKVHQFYVNSLKEKRNDLDGKLAIQMQLEEDLKVQYRATAGSTISYIYSNQMSLVRGKILSIKNAIKDNERKIRGAEMHIKALKHQLTHVKNEFFN